MNTIKLFLRYFLLFALIALIAFIAGCGSGSQTTADVNGTVLVRLFWVANSDTQQGKSSPKTIAGVYAIRIFVNAADMTEVQKEFPSTYDTCSLEGLAPGSNRTVRVQGLDLDGVVIYQGMASNIRVSPGQITDLGFIVMQSYPQPPSTALSVTIGSSINDVISIHGAPQSIQVNTDSTEFRYGTGDSISLSNSTNKVISWDNTNGSLLVSVVPGSNTTGSSRITLGSSLDDVITIQGVPKSIQVGSDNTTYTYETGDTIVISNTINMVIAWNNSKGALLVSLTPESNTTGTSKITLGSTLDDVITIQGTPQSIQTTSSDTTFTYHTTDSIRISNTTNKVISWNNPGGSLQILMVPGINVTNATKITLGSTLDDVIAIQGTPLSIQPGTSSTVYIYGAGDTLSIANFTNKVVSWNNPGGSLQILMVPGINVTNATKITLGSTLDDVIAIQGTPLAIQPGTNSTVYMYGAGDTITIANSTSKVVSWNNQNGSLKVLMVPGNNTTGATKITLGSPLDDVVAIQGTPRSIQILYSSHVYNYGYSDSVSISSTTNKVISWNNTRGSLNVNMIAGSYITGSTKITLGSTMDDVIVIQGTPVVIQAFTDNTIFNYVMSDSVSISNRTKTVVSWKNQGGSLHTYMVAGADISDATKISLGVTRDDVIKIQGTPISILVNSSNTVFYYGQNDSVSISNTTNKVTSWNNPNGSLLLL